MKKLLLLFVGLLLTAVSAIAQPAKPEVKYTSFADAIEASHDNPVYFYNTEAGLFLNGSMWWGARACLASNGKSSGDNWFNYDDFLFGNANVNGEKWSINENPVLRDGIQCYYFTNQSRTDASRYLTNNNLATGDDIWVDTPSDKLSERPHDGWYIDTEGVTETNAFRIGYISVKTENETTTYPKHGWFGAQKLKDKDLNTFILNDVTNATWAIVDETEYQRVLPLLQIYHISLGLDAQLTTAKAQGLSEDFSSYESLMTQENVKFDDIKAAITKITAAIEFGKVILEAKEVDASRDWSKYVNIYASAESKEKDFTDNAALLKAFIALKKAIDEGKKVDATHFTKAEDMYKSDASKLEDLEAETKIVIAATALKKVLDEATTRGCDVAQYTAIYNKENVTEAELNEATPKVQNIIDDYDIAQAVQTASPTNPVNFTKYIVNPTFDVVGTFDGWTGPFGAGGTVSTNAEIYGKSFDCYQDIQNMRPGVYMVVVNGYTRYKNKNEDYIAWKEGQVSETKIYMKGDTYGQYFTPVKHVSEGGQATAFYGEQESIVYFDGEGNILRNEEGGFLKDEEAEKIAVSKWYTPNTMKAADEYFHKSGEGGGASDRYRNEAFGALGEGDVLRIGVFNNKATGSDWSIFDDFQLFYLGDGNDAYQKWAENTKDVFTKIEVEDEVYYGAPELETYNGLVDALSTASDKETVTKTILGLSPAQEAIETSKTKYAAYVAAVKEAEDWLENNPGTKNDYVKLQEYMTADDQIEEWGWPNGPVQVIIPNYGVDGYAGTLSAEAIEKETEYVKEMLLKAKRSTYDFGSDITSELVNPNFEEADGKGWKLDSSNGGTEKLTNWRGGSDSNHCAEAFNQNFDVYQELEGLPDGLYEVSVQAFYRTAANKEAWEAYQTDKEMVGSAKVLSEVYLNEFSTPIRNVMEIQFADKELDENNTNTYHPENTVIYTLDGMVSASNAFNLEDPARNFTMAAYGIVTDGKIRLGIRNLTGSNDKRWTLWDNFKLTYRAKDPATAQKVLTIKSKELGALIDENRGNMTATALQEAVYRHEESQKTNLNDNVKYTVLEATNKAINAVKDNVKAVEAYKKANLAYDNAYYDLNVASPLDENNPTEIWSKVLVMDKELEGDAYKDVESDEELNELTAKIEQLTEEMYAAIDVLNAQTMLEDLAKATDEEPVDVTKYIVNPDFEDAETLMNGWTYYKGSDSGAAKNEGDKRIDDERCGNYIFNTWNGKAPDGGFYVAQTIKCLPAGTYKLEAILSSDKNNVITLSANENSADFTMVDEDKHAPFDAELTFKIGDEASAESNLRKAEEATLTNVEIKASSGSWFKADNFRLTYYGAESEIAPTEIEEIDAQPTVKNGKYIENGQLIIIRDGKKYNAMGVLLN